MSPRRTSYVYALVDPRNDEVRYIGITKREPFVRFNSHIGDARKNTHTRKRAWIRSLLNENLEPTFAVIESGNFAWEELCALEIAYIAQYTLEGHDLTNETEGGDGLNGFAAPRTPEWRQRLSEATKRQMASYSPEEIAKMQEHRVSLIRERNGGVFPGYTKGRPSPVKGRTLSEETKAKMREAHKARWAKLKADGRYEEVCSNIAAGTKRAMNREGTS